MRRLKNLKSVSLVVLLWRSVFGQYLTCFFKNPFGSKGCLPLLIILFLPFFSYSQSYRLDYLTTRSGLSQNHVNCIYQDREGFIWIGTYNGLNRYDGYNIETFHSSREPFGLTQDAVNVIFQDSKGFLWIGTDLGLNKFDPWSREFTHYYNLNPDSTLHIENNVRTIHEDSDGLFWVGFYGGGIKIFDPETAEYLQSETVFEEELLPQHAKVNDFFEDQSGVYWIGTENTGLVEYHPQTKQIIRHFAGKEPGMLTDDLISSIAQDNNGNLWVGTWNGGINIYDPDLKEFRLFEPDGGSLIVQSPVSSVFIENDLVWIATMGNGIFSYDLKTATVNHLFSDLGMSHGLNNDIVWTVYRDKSGVVWLGTYGGGVNLFYPGSEAFHSYRPPGNGENQIHNGMISAVLELPDSEIIVGVLGGGVTLFDRNTEQFSALPNELDELSLNVRFLFEDDNQNIWFSTDEGLYRSNADLTKTDFFPLKLGVGTLGNKSVYSIFQDRRGNMWFGLWGAGVKKLKSGDVADSPGEVLFYSYHLAGFVGNTVWSFFQDSRGRLWVGAGNGLYWYDYDKDIFVEEKGAENELDGISISSFSEDVVNNRLVMGTLGKGLAFMDMDKKSVEFINAESGLLRNEVFSVHADALHNFWICTNNGISRYDNRSGQFRHINVEMGMQDNELLNKSWRLNSGEILVGGNNGFYLFNPIELVDSPFEPNVVVTGFQVDGVDRPLEKNQKQLEAYLKPGDNTFAVDFAALDYRMSDKIEYQYKLDGFDGEWITAHAGNRRASYTNMDGGKYIFRVKASNSDGLWTGKENTIILHLASPFYQRKFFQVFASFLLLFLIYLFLRIRERKIKSNLQKRNALHDLNILQEERSLLEKNLNQKEKHFAAMQVFIRDKEERLLIIRDQIYEALQNARPEIRKNVSKLLGQIESETNDEEARKDYLANINLLHDGYIDMLAQAYPRLTQKDLLICGYIKSGKSNKEIAAQLAISAQSVEMSRYRIRKKMEIDSSVTLNDFLIRF